MGCQSLFSGEKKKKSKISPFCYLLFVKRLLNCSPAEPAFANCVDSDCQLLQRPTDLDLHCLSPSM